MGGSHNWSTDVLTDIQTHIYPSLNKCLVIERKVQRNSVHNYPANSGIKVRQWTTLLRRIRQIIGEMNNNSSVYEGKWGDKEDKTKESSPQTCVINIKTEKPLKFRIKSMKNERKTEKCQKMLNFWHNGWLEPTTGLTRGCDTDHLAGRNHKHKSFCKNLYKLLRVSPIGKIQENRAQDISFRVEPIGA